MKGLSGMKFKHFFIMPLCGALALLGMAGCTDDDLGNTADNNRPKGNGIVFGASANYVGTRTRTIYGDYDNVDNPTSQELLWESDDRVEIFSPESPTVKQVEYQVANIQTDAGDAYLASYQGQDGLQWSSNETQNFYAVYPSKASMVNQEMANRYVSFENGVLTGFIPTNQQQTISKKTGRWVATPNMDWQYMAARAENFQVPAADATDDGGITLNFKPLVTTLEVTLVGPSSPLAQLNVEAPEDVTIMGRFSCDLKGGTWDNNQGVPTCVAEQTGTTTNYVTVNLYDDNNQPLKLEEGEEITFNIFMLPVENLTDIRIRIAGFNTASRTLALEDADQGKVTLEPNKKTRVRIKAPNIGEHEINKWIGGLNDNVLVSQLSIPGTANSFSYNYTSTDYEKWRTQTATIDEQWNAGVRCFELVCGENDGDVENSPLLCNRHEIGGDISMFGQAVEAIWRKVQENPTEFAIIIPSYDSNTGHPKDHNGVDKFANGLNAFYNNHSSYKYKTFTRELTVGEARGSMIFIARITSEEDGDYQVSAPVQGTFVDQWGSLKDNWWRRGYTLSDGTRVTNWSSNNDDAVEHYMMTSVTNRTQNMSPSDFAMPAGFPTRVDANVNFIHTARRGGDGTGTGQAYIQDWVRVVPRDGVVSGLYDGGFNIRTTDNWVVDSYLPYQGHYEYTHYFVYWPESLTEKEGDIWKTFEKSIEHNSQSDGGSMFFINSLDGYFVDPDIELSYTPYVDGGNFQGLELGRGGTEGNILEYANYINNWFYNEILTYGVTNIYGPMNIVLMDYVYDGTAGGDRLPSTIINNNFRFPLKTKGGGATQNQGLKASGSYASGGNVWE